MAWPDEMTMVIRYMVGDTDDTAYKYTDARYKELLIVSALFVNRIVDFNWVYTIRPTTYTISPDPTLDTSRDDDFIALVCLKGASILIRGELKVAANNGIMFKDRDTMVDSNSKILAMKATMKEYDDQFEEARWFFQLEGRALGKAILGSLNLPTNFQGNNYGYYRGLTGRY